MEKLMTTKKNDIVSAEIHRYKTPDGVFEIAVKSEFLKIIPDPEKHPLDKLMSDNNLANYLHNPHGPAILVLRSGYGEYWLDGKKCDEAQTERIKHNVNFHDKLENILDT
jgi:hypothetical protein